MASINHNRIFNQTITILNSNSLHFFTLSLLFLPLTVFSAFNLTTDFQNLLTPMTIATLIAVIIPALLGVTFITYSTFHAIRRTPISFTLTFKAFSRSFVLLLFTFFIGSMKVILMSLLITQVFITVNSLVLGFRIESLRIYSHVLMVVTWFYLVAWGSAAAIVVSEIKLGSEALNQSANQSAKFRLLSFLILLATICGVESTLTNCLIFTNIRPVSMWISVVHVGVNYMCSLWMIVIYVVANTLLFVECRKVARGDKEVPARDDRLLSHGGFSYMMCVCLIVWSISVSIGFD
nr:immediate-early protein like [Tanacetum cinerariifolium]